MERHRLAEIRAYARDAAVRDTAAIGIPLFLLVLLAFITLMYVGLK